MFSLLYTEDGNDSLKRFLNRDVVHYEGDNAILGLSKDYIDTRKIHNDYLLPRQDVDKWHDKGQELMADKLTEVF